MFVNPTDQDRQLKLPEKNNVFLIDWLTVVFHNASVPFVQALLGMPAPEFPWETERVFRNGYPMQTKYKHITILWGADDAQYFTSDEKKSASEKVRIDMGICLDMSGQGCREFESEKGNDWLKLIADIMDRSKTNITRLDLAYDDHIGLLDINRIAADVRDRNYTSPSRKSRIIWSDDHDEDIQGLTVEIGSKKSAVMTRIYDKAAERGFDHSRHWVRVEMQLRDDRAFAAVAMIHDRQLLGMTAAGILRNYLQFRVPLTMDTNKSRWPIAPYWDRVLLDMERISIWISPGEEYNFSKTEQHLVFQYGQAMLTYMKINGSLEPLLMQALRLYPVLNKKYQAVIDQYEHNQERARAASEALAYEMMQFQELPLDDVDDDVITNLFGDVVPHEE